MATLEALSRAGMIAAALRGITGIEARVVGKPQYAAIQWGPSEAAALRGWVERQTSKAPGDIRVEYMPALTPLMVRKAIPWVIGVLAVGYLAGKVL